MMMLPPQIKGQESKENLKDISMSDGNISIQDDINIAGEQKTP